MLRGWLQADATARDHKLLRIARDGQGTQCDLYFLSGGSCDGRGGRVGGCLGGMAGDCGADDSASRDELAVVNEPPRCTFHCECGSAPTFMAMRVRCI